MLFTENCDSKLNDMAKIKPFKAVRPAPDKVALVTCRNYDDYSPAELAAWLDFNPYSFLHIIHPAYLHSQKTTFDKRFKGVANKYQDYKNEKILITDDKDSFYVYEIQTKWQSFTGIIAGTSIADYQNNIIKKHEDTLQYRVELFKDYLHQTQFNAEPVLMTFAGDEIIESFLEKVKHNIPLYHFSTTNKEKHTLWKIDGLEGINWLINYFEKQPELYIADGHHRSASAELLFQEDQSLQNENLNCFMSFLIPENQIKIYEYNRMIHDLNGLDTPSFLKILSKNFVVSIKDNELWKPKCKGEFGMYIEGNFYELKFKNDLLQSGILKNLDAQILYDYILNSILGIEDLRNDERIDYISGKESALIMKNQIDDGDYKVGFLLYPSSIDEIKKIADHQLIMPPKSTYIEPKFRSGLLVYEL
jgi:uncharacterized protein (DUF1015 family)